MLWCDVQAKLLELHIPFRTASHGEVRINCPFCNDHKLHLYINEEKGVFHCFRCETSGPVERLFLFLEGEEQAFASRPAPQYRIDDEHLDLVELPEGYSSDFLRSEEGRQALQYLQSRGIDEDTIRMYSIGFCATGKYRGRIIVPIFHRGILVSFVARAYHEGLTPKVLNPSQDEAPAPSNFLFNLDRAVFFPSVVIVEGVFDALTTGVIDGRYCAVATFGKHLTDNQIQLLLLSGFEEVVFAWDTRDAIPQILSYARKLLPFFKTVRVAFLPGNEDPNSLGREQMAVCVRSAEPFEVARLRMKYLLRFELNNGNFNGNRKTQKFGKNFLMRY